MSVSRDPAAEAMNGATPPTEPKARTGEFTPPGVTCTAEPIAASLLTRLLIYCSPVHVRLCVLTPA